MTIDKEEIKALALACAPSKCADEAEEDRRLAEFHGELTPEGILALLAEIEHADVRLHEVATLCATVEQERDQLKAENEDYKSGQERYEQIIEDLKAENEALRKALGDLLSLYEDDEGCRNLPEYIAGRAAMAKEANHG